jgi:hypothetical protein
LSDFAEPTKGPWDDEATVVEAAAAVSVHATAEAVALGAVSVVVQDCFPVETE